MTKPLTEQYYNEIVIQFQPVDQNLLTIFLTTQKKNKYSDMDSVLNSFISTQDKLISFEMREL